MVGEVRERVGVRAIVHAEHDDRAHIRPENARVCTPWRGLGEPIHIAGATGLYEGAQSLGRLWDGIRRGDAAEIKAERVRPLSELRFEPQKSRSA